MEEKYIEKKNYGFSGEREGMGIRDKVYDDGSKIIARRGKDDRPQDYDSKEKVRILNKRRRIRKNLNDII